MTYRALYLLAATACLLLQSCASTPVKFERTLQAGRPLEGEIHGAYPDLNLYVLSYRNPKDFFDYVDVSLIAASPEVAAELAELHRHDRVRIEGSLADNRSQQRHVEVRSLDVVTKYEASPAIPPYEHQASIPDELAGKDNELFLVHAVNAGGAVLVVERKDGVLPVYVRRPELTRDLARNDVVRLHYVIRARPNRPVHLELADVERPVEVVDSITALHGKPAMIEGPLVLFPKSPQVLFNVFAVLQELPGDAHRQFTLANFDDPDTFTAIRNKLQAAWDAAGPGAAVSGRNKLVSTKVRVRVTGTYNQIDPNQANAQIVLSGPDAIEIVAQ
ncbi:MAG TPA: hypothetical protein VFX89_04490 [Gammaproteobacteria bacterium]|nr:hypothetical protein [Gammaproteobacteria bacterium]